MAVPALWALLFAVASLVSFGIWVIFKLTTVSVRPAMLSDSEIAVNADDDHARDAILAASFNPMHNGHLMLLRAIATRHSGGNVYAVVGHNPLKAYAVSPQERCSLLTMAIARDPELKNVKAVVVEGYIWRFAFKVDAEKAKREVAEGRNVPRGAILYRGIRSMANDLADERRLHALNLVGPLLLGPFRSPPETRYLTAPAEDSILSNVSSSEVRKRAATGESIRGLVPDAVKDHIVRLYSR